MTISVCPGSTTFTRHRTSPAKTRSVPHKPRCLATPLRMHPAGRHCGSGTAWNWGSYPGRALETNEHMLRFSNLRVKAKPKWGFRCHLQLLLSPSPLACIFQRGKEIQSSSSKPLVESTDPSIILRVALHPAFLSPGHDATNRHQCRLHLTNASISNCAALKA